jgi:hypothetical protein
MSKNKSVMAQVALNVELDAMQDYFERTGRQWYWLSNTQQRKEIEKVIEKENHEPTS